MILNIIYQYVHFLLHIKTKKVDILLKTFNMFVKVKIIYLSGL